MADKLAKKRDYHLQELSAWIYYIQKSVRVYTKNSMLRVGRKSWWSRIKEEIPVGFINSHGHIREPWLTRIALWLQNYGLKICECLDIQVDNIIPTAISVILHEAHDLGKVRSP